MSTDTACSSSLVACHLAHKGLVLAECNAAVAAGSNVMLLANTTAAICQLQVAISFAKPAWNVFLQNSVKPTCASAQDCA